MDYISLLHAHHQWASKQQGLRTTPGGYMKWSQYVRVVVENATMLAKGTTPKSAALREVLQAHAHEDIPPRYVSSSLLDAWLNTRVPGLTWNRPYVLPGYVLFFPVGDQSPGIDGKSVIAIVVLNKNEGLLAIPFTHFWQSGQWNVGLCHGLAMPAGFDYNDPSVNEHAKMIAKLVINSWYTHAFEPELITQEESRPGGGGFGKQRQARTPIPPTWIGRNFKIRRESAPAAGQETGIKVRPHWRSGHWHTVRHGKGREQERLQWYRPVYVNSDTSS